MVDNHPRLASSMQGDAKRCLGSDDMAFAKDVPAYIFAWYVGVIGAIKADAQLVAVLDGSLRHLESALFAS